MTDKKSNLSGANACGRVPVTILTGFLGSGKTTLLNALTARPDMAGVAVFINEFGDVGIDHHLVERVDDTLVILESGCLCCTVQGDLIGALMRLHKRMSRREISPVSRVLIETTGLADPAPVVRALMEDRLVSARFRCDGVLTVVDTERARAQIARHREARVQVSLADRLLLSKCDLASRAERTAVERELEALNPAAVRLALRHGEADQQVLFGGGLYVSGQAPAAVTGWLSGQRNAAKSVFHCEPHSGRVSSFVVTLEEATGWRGFAVTMGEILSRWAGRLLRVKGLVSVAGLDQPVAVQCVDSAVYAPLRLAAWPTSGPLMDRQGRLVFIGEDLDAHVEADIRARLVALPGDREALRRAAVAGLPTRTWLGERMPLTPRPGLVSDAFIIQPRVLGEMPARI
ncbi:GTP-binding protein [Rhizobium sp. YS-1r]|uniref:CobW family GTP-binding protein n=1 Tax=Rhizobium sp. YS-1r TaxID=1532558 RepID=UPI00068ECAA2|nr:GTP-binding protein [Rhizobium sp. YS-1r]